MVTLALRLLSVEKPASVDDLVAAIDAYLRETTKNPNAWSGPGRSKPFSRRSLVVKLHLRH
jgi:hypothetical protein